MVKARSSEKERFWRRLFENHESSGLNVDRFCRRVGISVASFYAWRRTLRLRDAEVRATRSIQRAASLVPVRVLTTDTESPIQIVWPSGMSFRIPSVGDAAMFRQVLEIVHGLARQEESPC